MDKRCRSVFRQIFHIHGEDTSPAAFDELAQALSQSLATWNTVLPQRHPHHRYTLRAQSFNELTVRVSCQNVHSFIYAISVDWVLFSMVQQPLMGQGLLIIEASQSHWDTPHSVELPWTSYQPDAETSAWQPTTHSTDRHPCPRWDTSPQCQEASSHRPMP
jgi:hypothetical protein